MVIVWEPRHGGMGLAHTSDTLWVISSCCKAKLLESDPTYTCYKCKKVYAIHNFAWSTSIPLETFAFDPEASEALEGWASSWTCTKQLQVHVTLTD